MSAREELVLTPTREAVLDEAHVGDIRGAFGTISRDDVGARNGWKARLKTLLAILGPGLIVMVGDNDAGAFSTYGQAGQNYGTSLLWTLLLLVPVLYVNQEMVLRLGAVTGVGHARLVLERFGKFWGAFSAIDLFLINALTIVTEFIGISLGMAYLGVPKLAGVGLAAAFVVLAASTGDFRKFERMSLALVAGSLLLVPVFVLVHPPLAQVGHDLVVPHLPVGAKLSDVMLLVIAIIGTTVAPWQLFFQQSYVIDKRITPRFISYERVDLVIGIVLVVIGAGAMIAFAAATFAGQPEFGQFRDAGALAAGLETYHGRLPAVLFAVALIDASIIGAAAVSLSTAYVLGDVLALKHSLHRKPSEAKLFYAVFVGLIALGAALVLLPGVPLGLLTNAVQSMAGIVLPSATVFLLMLCNDKQVLGPWVNGRMINIVTGMVVTMLLVLSIILTAAVLQPDISSTTIRQILIGGGIVSLLAGLGMGWVQAPVSELERKLRSTWRMPPLAELAPLKLSLAKRLTMIALRVYTVAALVMVIVKVVQLAIA
jgi:Mn2+/Fe2+ NRAMP family transporter